MNPKRLKEARKKAGLTQEKLAEYLDIEGVGASTRIANYESGRYAPTFETMQKIAKLLDVPEYYFYILDDNEASLLLDRFRGKSGKSLSNENVNLLKDIENKLRKVNNSLS
jgi:transcriptional regulator with XRE-family HTH domain